MSLSPISKSSLTPNAAVYIQGIQHDINGFIFDIEGTSTIDSECDITDHYIENNTAIQDHIGHKPVKITLKNYQGEVTTNKPQDQKTPVVITKLDTNAVLVPDSALPQTQQSQGVISNNQANDNVDTSQQNIYNQVAQSINNVQTDDSSTRQQIAFNFFKALQDNNFLFTINSYLGTFEDYALEKITPFQDEDTKYMSTFTLVFHEMRFADTQLVAFDPSKYYGRAQIQNQPATTSKSNGTNQNSPEQSELNDIINSIKAPNITNSHVSLSQQIKTVFPQ
jgi:hypothetical protein